MLLGRLNNSLYIKCFELCLLTVNMWCQLLVLLFIKCEFRLLKNVNDMKFQIIRKEEVISLGIYTNFSDFSN